MLIISSAEMLNSPNAAAGSKIKHCYAYSRGCSSSSGGAVRKVDKIGR